MNQKELVQTLRTKPVFYIEKNLYIRTKIGTLTKLHLNYVQTQVVNYVIECLDNKTPIRIIILKARQEGMSTVIEAIIFWYTATHKHISSRIIAHDGESSNNLFGMTKTYYERLAPFIKPLKRYSNRKQLVFENPDEKKREEKPGLGSKVIVSTAGNVQAGRSETNQLIHASEIAFWEHPEELMAGMMQTVPYAPNTMIFLESTANGVGGYFYDEYQRAKRGDSVFKAFFFGWNVHEEYSLEPPTDFEPSEEEQKLKEEYSLTNGQLYWRRIKKKELEETGGKFEQEYPINDFEAFVASGRPRFDVDTLKNMLLAAQKPIRGEVEFGKFNQDKKGKLSVWKLPVFGGSYVIGVDPAEGLEKGDNSVIEVFDRFTGEQCAEWCGKCDPDVLGDKTYLIAKFYNEAFVGCESNNHGLTTLKILKQQYNYPHLYYRQVLDDRFEKKTNKLGWNTSVRTKPIIIDEMAVWIREKHAVFYSKELVEECMTYVVDDNGRTNAQEGCYDDRVMATAICLQMFKNTNTIEEADPRIRFGNRFTRR
jgi:hypothetical protein